MAASGSQSHRFLLPDPPFVVHLDSAFVLENNATDGFDTDQCADQDR